MVGCNILWNRGNGEGLNILSQYKTKRFEKLTLHRTVNFVFCKPAKQNPRCIYSVCGNLDSACLVQITDYSVKQTILHNLSILTSFISILISTYYDNFFRLLIIFGLDDPGFLLG